MLNLQTKTSSLFRQSSPLRPLLAALRSFLSPFEAGAEGPTPKQQWDAGLIDEDPARLRTGTNPALREDQRALWRNI